MIKDSKCKICRRLGAKLFLKGERCFSPKCAMVKRPYPPGKKRKRRARSFSEYAVELKEKQKLKNWYNLSEKQFKSYAKKALSSKGKTEDLTVLFIKSLENRLDNIVFRLGFAKSRSHARQMVSHGNFLVNKKSVNIPSYQTKKGDVISVVPKKTKGLYFKEIEPSLKKYKTLSWLELNAKKMEGKIISDLILEEIIPPVEIESIFEHYSR